MAESPLIDAEGVLHLTVASNGAAVPHDARLITASVRHATGAIPSARLVYADGDVATQAFPLSDSAHFQPGAVISLRAGYGGGEERLLFEGIVVQQGIEVRGDNDARLIVECRDKAVQMTQAHRSATYAGQTDSAVIEALLGRAGLAAEVQATTTTTHAALVQHDCSDWDYLLARAQAAGLVVHVHAGRVSARVPQTSGDAALKLSYGTDLITFRADTERAPAPQAAKHRAAARGQMQFQGSALALPGAWVELVGVGERFSGDALLSDVRHELADGNWLTEAHFRLPPYPAVESSTPATQAAASDALATASARRTGVKGLQLGQVIERDGDPTGAMRVRVSVPGVPGDSLWARLAQFHGSSGFGAFFVPEVGDEVVLGYFDNDPAQPVVLGSLYSSTHRPPYDAAAGGPVKAIVTRGGARIEFNEAEQAITLRTPQKNSLVISDHAHGITLVDQNGNQLELGPAGIGLHSPKDITLSAKGGITIDAVGEVRVSSKGADVKATGLNVSCDAKVGFTAKGQATAELSAAGQTTVKGAMVLIN